MAGSSARKSANGLGLGAFGATGVDASFCALLAPDNGHTAASKLVIIVYACSVPHLTYLSHTTYLSYLVQCVLHRSVNRHEVLRATIYAFCSNDCTTMLSGDMFSRVCRVCPFKCLLPPSELTTNILAVKT